MNIIKLAVILFFGLLGTAAIINIFLKYLENTGIYKFFLSLINRILNRVIGKEEETEKRK